MAADESAKSDLTAEAAPPDPGAAAVSKYLLYSLSIPERALRSGGALVGGAVRESASLLVPQAFQSSKTYAVMVQQMLDFLAEDVGGVERATTDSGNPKVENFVARKTVGNFVEMAGLATLHLSPMLVLAAVSDIAYGSQTMLRELADELKRDGVIAPDTSVQHVDDLLAAVAQASGITASAFDTPPLSVDGLKDTVAQTRAALAQIDPAKAIPQAEIARLWGEMRDIAVRERVSPLAVSSAMTFYALGHAKNVGRGALSGLRVAGNLLDRHVLDHYTQSLGEIRRRGLYTMLRETSGPYVEAVWRNFSTDKPTVTEDLLSGKLAGQAWTSVRRWLGYEPPKK